MVEQIKAILEPKEQIVWQGAINKKVITFYFFLAVIIVTLISYFIFSQEIIDYTSNGVPKSIAGSTVGLVLFLFGILISVFSFLSKLVIEYIITNKRVVIKSGLIGTDFNAIYLNEVRTVNVNVGLIDKIFSVGTVNIDVGKVETVTSGSGNDRQSGVRTAYEKLLHIDSPYEVYKHFLSSSTKRQESLYSGRADRENKQT
jgi:membrane protein YdbS with pleckstrin-like domain